MLPSSLYQVDFSDSLLTGEELLQAVTAYEDKWLAEVYSFQCITDKMYGEPRTCSMVKCLPKHLRNRYYEKYYDDTPQLREYIKKIIIM